MQLTGVEVIEGKLSDIENTGRTLADMLDVLERMGPARDIAVALSLRLFCFCGTHKRVALRFYF